MEISNLFESLLLECVIHLSTSVKIHREDKQIPPPAMPRPLSPGPEIEGLKREIVYEIKQHFDSRKYRKLNLLLVSQFEMF